ncbi:hypothetical protein CRG98_018093 [Punica granatum]|uniref:Integrase catalytic domain-containing protein n=1 Tax=Punica granatum TaxID=22663 RepID=A0A2I0JYU7_PUNGR|nr:hypothetical protein CRG98_018093 [Punica granatum]
MAEEDKIKTTFITMWGTFCYKVMSFGLKNAGASCHWAMVTLFHDMMHKEIEVYVDDMIAKSKEGQKDDSLHAERAIYYLSKNFTEGESNYPKIEKMCCALVWVMQRLQQYALYHTVHLLSKADPLKYLLDSPSSMRNVAKWRCQLTEYDIEYVSRTSVKGQAIADHLAEFPIDDDTPINSDFPDERILQVSDEEETLGWKMYFDGAVNYTGSGISAVLISPEGRHFPVAAKIDFPCTNNIAEYEACILGLQAAIDLKVKELKVFGDFMLTIFQTLKQWKTKDPKPVLYHEYLEELIENFEDISFTYTPRMKNQFAFALATLASMVSITKENLIEPLEFEIAQGPAHCDVIDAVDGKSWYADIKHLLQTAIDYFTKWIEAITLASVTAKTVARFLKSDIIARYGVPATLITDNAKNLNNKFIDELCAQFKIQHRNSSPYRPQMNGAVEEANKNIKKIIVKMTVNYKNWHEMLPFALLVYQTSIRSSIGATPYSLVYGMEAVLSIEVEIPSMRVFAESKLEEAEWAKQRYEHLNLIDERRLTALCHGQCYQQRMARTFNKKVPPHEFSPSDLVLRKVLHIAPDSRGKSSRVLRPRKKLGDLRQLNHEMTAPFSVQRQQVVV